MNSFEMSKLMDIIGSVPQRPDYHAEGPVGIHTRMVRAQLDKAISLIQKEASKPNSFLSNLDTNYTEQDRNILRMAAWLHDIGKASATKIGGIHWQDERRLKNLYGDKPNLGQARAIGHEQFYHFNPMARELMKSSLWKKMYDNAGFEDKKDLWFIINHHMDVTKSKKMLRRNIDPDGKFRNDRRLKLLLAFSLMDKMGRISGMPMQFSDEDAYFQELEAASQKVKKMNLYVNLL